MSWRQSGPPAAFWALVVCLVLPSLAQVEKYTGRRGMVGYAVLAPVALWTARGWILPWARRRLPARAAGWLALATGLALVPAFRVLLTLANSGRFGPGSDTDEAYDQAVAALLAGRYPYDPVTYLGNRIHHLPGALLLATPFVVLGTSAYQNLFWLALLFLVARRLLGSTREALLLAWAVPLLSPVVAQQAITGADAVTNGAQVAVLAWCAVEARGGWQVASALGFGLALSSRPNFLLAALPVLGCLAARRGWAEAIRRLALAGAAWLAVTLPFYLHDPGGFAPLEGANRLSRFAGILPDPTLVIAGAATLLSALLAWRRATRSTEGLLGAIALGQAFVVVAGIALSSIQAGAFDPGYAGYGGFFLPAGVLAWWRDATSPGPALAGMLAGGAAAPERPEPGRQWRC